MDKWRKDGLSRSKRCSKKWGLSPRQVQKLFETGRIKGSFRIGSVWAIPANAEKPIDRRTTAGKKEKANSQSFK
ncbi:MAG: DNA-binding protein [Clostridiales Family XIII bacterium]|nr:DNA-binding protein [Clostridiales Family XIII bacterium]